MTLRAYIDKGFPPILILPCFPANTSSLQDFLYHIQNSAYPQVLLLTIGYKFRREESN